MSYVDIIRKIIKEALKEVEIIDEERIANKKASEEIFNRENFIGSHTFGEDLGGLGELYVAYSYGEEHPLYVWVGNEDKWYYNHDDYILPNGKVNKWTRKHLRDLRPTIDVTGVPGSFLRDIIDEFKEKHSIELSHTPDPPGEDS